MFATHAYASNISNKLLLKNVCKFCAIISSEYISKSSVDTLWGHRLRDGDKFEKILIVYFYIINFCSRSHTFKNVRKYAWLRAQ